MIIRKMGDKSTLLTYLLWLVGGVFGLHHFYLGRDSQAFLWWSTLGGYVGCGWLRDLFYIPTYVADANGERAFIEKLVAAVRTHDKPPFSTTRFCGMVIVGYLWASVLMLAVPEDEVAGINWRFLLFLGPLACALGVWTVGNIGHEEGSIWWPLIAAYLTSPLYFYFHIYIPYLDDSTAFTLMVFCSAWAFDSKAKQWRRTPKKKKSLARRVATLTVCALIYTSLWTSYLYFNAKLVDAEGEEIPVHKAVHHFLTSPWWLDLKQSLHDTWTFAQAHGWSETWKQIVELSDPHGEQNAYKVLGVSAISTQSEIKAKYRALSLEWHPDKAKDPESKRIAQEKFVEIQQAYEILSTIKSKRKSRSRKSDPEWS